MTRVLACAVVTFLTASTSFGETGIALPDRDVLVVLGGGVSPPWDTEFELANGASVPVNVEIGNLSVPLSESRCPTPTPCFLPVVTLMIPANGSVRKRATEGIGMFFPSTLYVVQVSGDREPTVRARVFDRTRPDRSADLPVVRKSTITALNPTLLVFPGATRSAAVRTNLVVAEVSGDGGLELLVEAYSAEGERLGGEQLTVGAGDAFSGSGAVFLVDVLARLGVPALENGQVRVTKTGGNGLMWGLLATVHDEGRVSVSLGMNP